MSNLSQFLSSSTSSSESISLKSFSSNISLASSDIGKVLLNPSSNSLTVSLPDATTLNINDNFYLINASENSYDIIIKDFNNNISTILDSCTINLYLFNNSSVSGNWIAINRHQKYIIYSTQVLLIISLLLD